MVIQSMREMKTSKMIFILFSLICLSCQTQKTDKPVDFKISKILIHLYSGSKTPCLFMVDMDKNELLFQRIGLKKQYATIDSSQATSEVNAIIIKMDSFNHDFFENFKFNDSDFIDYSGDHLSDGYTLNMLITYQDGKCQDVENVVNTPNQIKLIRYLISMASFNQKESSTIDYLKELSERFK